jgi:hypothetical protein
LGRFLHHRVLISSWNLSSKSCSNFGRVSGQSMLLRVKDLNCVLQFFGAYMIIQHWARCLGESRKAILHMCIATRTLSQGDWRTRYVTLGIVVSFQLTIHWSLVVLIMLSKLALDWINMRLCSIYHDFSWYIYHFRLVWIWWKRKSPR